MNRRAPLLLALALLGTPLSASAGEGETAPIGTALVDTDLRTLRGCPLKAIVTRAEDWARVVDGLPGAPPAPDFASQAAALVVIELPPQGQAQLEEFGLTQEGDLRVVIHRRDPDPPVSGLPTLRCFFFYLPPPKGGVLLEYRTQVWGGTGYVSRLALPGPGDRDPTRLPLLGPDVRLSVAPPPGGRLPPNLALRQEARFPNQPDLERRVTTTPWPEGGTVALGMRYPRVHGVEHLLAAHGDGQRSRNPLRIDALPGPDGSGSPAPVVHTFQLEPVPE